MDTPPLSPRSVVVSDLDRMTSASPSRGGNTLLFPWKLQDMLQTSISEGKESIVSWLSHGNAFKVHNVLVFVSEILPLFFKQTKYKSFQRQLNLWGFERIQHGPEKGSYYHKHFLRDKPNLCRHLTRREQAKKVHSVIAANATTKTTPFPKKSSNVRQVSPIPSRFNPIPRNLSKESLQEGFEELLGKLHAKSCYRLDLAEFEGVTFHLLEQDRYEELKLEFEFNSRQDQNTSFLKELEQGSFGIPRMGNDTFELKPLDT